MNRPRPTCTRCLYPADHPFGLALDENGVCTGCRVHEEKFSLDWPARATHLRDTVIPSILGKRRNDDYDCVVPVRGSPESFKVLDIVKNDLGLNPLVVAYNSQFNTAAGIANIDLIRESFDVDFRFYTSNPEIYRKLVRESLARFSSIRWPFLAGETQFPVRVAVDKRIPLVIWPVHQATEQAGAHSYLEEPEMSRRSRHCYDLLGWEPDELATTASLLQPTHIEDLEYPSDAELLQSGVRGVYLANYYPWDSRRYAEEMVRKYGAHCARQPRTFDTYDRIDDATYMTVHDLLKRARLGYSRVTDQLCREIRFGRISRADAAVIAAHYEAQPVDAAIAEFVRWLGLSRDALSWILREPEFPSAPAPGRLSAKLTAFIESYLVNHEPITGADPYILFGKGLSL
jgi:N-acetyl sugar amidotransferase